jgi:hypothetical protein
MDRAAVTFGTTDSNSSVLDRSALGVPDHAKDRARASSLGPPRADAILPESAIGSPATCSGEGASAEPEVVPHDVWAQLPVLDRQRFGHRFSFMVLKALGLRPCPAKEVLS